MNAGSKYLNIFNPTFKDLPLFYLIPQLNSNFLKPNHPEPNLKNFPFSKSFFYYFKSHLYLDPNFYFTNHFY